MKSTTVDESLSNTSTDVLFQGIPTNYMITSTKWETYIKLNKMNAWGSCTKKLPSVWPELAYRIDLDWLGPQQELGDTPIAILPHGPVPPQLGLGGRVSQASKRRQSGRTFRVEKWCSHSRGRDRLRQHQSPSSQCPSQYQSPSPSPPIPSCQWAAQLLHGRSPPKTEIPQVQEQGTVRWHPHTYWGETKEETSQVWCGWGVGQWSHIAPGSYPLPSQGSA